jgi:hypothetical protein
MHQWAFDVDAQADLREEVGRERCVPDWLIGWRASTLMAHVT